MDVSELPMILFTVLAQMSVGAFLTLGVVQTLAAGRFSTKAIDRLAEPALLAIGPTLVLGLIVSMFHMHDVMHTFNVIRHAGSSWLSREILFGVGFAGFGFVFTAMQWFRWGTPVLRRALAIVTAVIGLGLVWSMANVYASLHTVPAWNSWFTIVQFFATTIILGSLAVGTAFVVVTHLRQRQLAAGATVEDAAVPDTELTLVQRLFRDRLAPVDAPTRAEVDRLLAVSIRGIVIACLVAAGVLLVALPIYLSGIAATGGGIAAHSAHVYSGAVLATRLVLLVSVMGLLGVFVYILAGRRTVRPLAMVMSAVLVLAFVGEFLGRSLFYESMMRVGV